MDTWQFWIKPPAILVFAVFLSVGIHFLKTRKR